MTLMRDKIFKHWLQYPVIFWILGYQQIEKQSLALIRKAYSEVVID